MQKTDEKAFPAIVHRINLGTASSHTAVSNSKILRLPHIRHIEESRLRQPGLRWQ